MRVCRKCQKQFQGDGKICRACGSILDEIDDVVPAVEIPEPNVPNRPESFPRLASGTRPANPRAPLGLPSGSIRALLTLLIVAVVIVQSVRGQEIDMLWTETLMIALAHYFTSRRLVRLPPEILDQLKKEGQLETEAHPLFLPRHSIRAILLLAFVGLGVYLYVQHRLLQSPSLSILGVVFAYFLGMVLRFKGIRGWEDLKAVVVLVVMAGIAAAYLLDRNDLVPHAVRNVTLGLVLFYFGSR